MDCILRNIKRAKVCWDGELGCVTFNIPFEGKLILPAKIFGLDLGPLMKSLATPAIGLEVSKEP